MPAGLQFTYGTRRLLDAHQAFTRSGLPVYLRLRNFTDQQQARASEYGFAVSPSGMIATGTTDILITPPPTWRMVSQHNIGMSDGRLLFGARTFKISHTFALAQMADRSLTDARMVWLDQSVVGLVTENLLCAVVQAVPAYAAGDVVCWNIIANCSEIR